MLLERQFSRVKEKLLRQKQQEEHQQIADRNQIIEAIAAGKELDDSVVEEAANRFFDGDVDALFAEAKTKRLNADRRSEVAKQPERNQRLRDMNATIERKESDFAKVKALHQSEVEQLFQARASLQNEIARIEKMKQQLLQDEERPEVLEHRRRLKAEKSEIQAGNRILEKKIDHHRERLAIAQSGVRRLDDNPHITQTDAENLQRFREDVAYHQAALDDARTRRDANNQRREAIQRDLQTVSI